MVDMIKNIAAITLEHAKTSSKSGQFGAFLCALFAAPAKMFDALIELLNIDPVLNGMEYASVPVYKNSNLQRVYNGK